jgi:hypothetical protein
MRLNGVTDPGISCALRLIANRNKKNTQIRLSLGDLGQQRLHDDAISSRPGQRSIAIAAIARALFTRWSYRSVNSASLPLGV